MSAPFVIFGGESLAGPRHLWWNFVSSSRGLLLEARRPEAKVVVVYYGTFDIRKERG